VTELHWDQEFVSCPKEHQPAVRFLKENHQQKDKILSVANSHYFVANIEVFVVPFIVYIPGVTLFAENLI